MHCNAREKLLPHWISIQDCHFNKLPSGFLHLKNFHQDKPGKATNRDLADKLELWVEVEVVHF